jgi:hypothetical protein
LKIYFDFILVRLKFRLIFAPLFFLTWYYLFPGVFTLTSVVINSILLSVVYILAVIVIDYKINSNTAEKLHVPVEKIYQARYEVGWSTQELLDFGENFQLFLDTQIHNMAVAKTKEELNQL